MMFSSPVIVDETTAINEVNNTVKPEVALATWLSTPNVKNNGLSIIPPPKPRYPAKTPPNNEFPNNLLRIFLDIIKSSSSIN